MPVNTIAQGNISISAINTENTATTSNSLKDLSTTAVEAGNVSTLNEAPYLISEFSGYTHATPYSDVGPDTVIIGGAASGLSMSFWSDALALQDGFVPPTFIAGFDVRFTVFDQYIYPIGFRTFVTQTFEKNATNGVYRNTSNSQVTMSDNTQYVSHSQNDFGGLDYMSSTTGFDEFKLVWTTNGISIIGDTSGASGSISQQNIGSHTNIANGTWYSAGPEGNTGTYGTTINLYGTKSLNQTGSANIRTTMTLETWVRNSSLGKSETKIRTQDIYLQGDATVAPSGGGGGGGIEP